MQATRSTDQLMTAQSVELSIETHRRRWMLQAFFDLEPQSPFTAGDANSHFGADKFPFRIRGNSHFAVPLASVRRGADPSQERQVARTAPTVKDVSDRFMVEHSEARNKRSTVRGNRITLKAHVLPALGNVKVADVKRSEIADLIGRLRPANRREPLPLATAQDVQPGRALGLAARRHEPLQARQEIHRLEAHTAHHRRRPR